MVNNTFYLKWQLIVTKSPVSTKEKAVDELFAGWGADEPGCSVGVVHQGETIFSKGYGKANLEHDIANASTTAFRIASITKQFTATAIALLAEQDYGFSLDDTLDSYFPEFPDYAKKITIQHLLNHTSGLRDHLQLTELAGWTFDYSEAQALELLYRQKALNFAPDSQFGYSNSGYLLLGKLVQKIAGQSLREFGDEYIFTPLGMKNTHFYDNATKIVRNRATGYQPDEKHFAINMTTMDIVADGGVYSTIEDMRFWTNNIIKNTLGKDPVAMGKLLTTAGESIKGKHYDYVFGKAFNKYKGLASIHHGGEFVGYNTFTRTLPTVDYAFTLFCNRNDLDAHITLNKITDIFLADKITPDTASKATQQTVSVNVKKITPPQPHQCYPLERYKGRYHSDELNTHYHLIIEDNKLYLIVGNHGKPIELTCENADTLSSEQNIASTTGLYGDPGTFVFNCPGQSEPGFYLKSGLLHDMFFKKLKPL
jgi:CubicO group peptidase (beta-lactamase class C family)